MNNKVCVIGIWHLGSVISACLADLGYHVIGFDKDQQRIKNLNKGIPPLFEPGLKELLLNNINLEKFSYTTNLSNALREINHPVTTLPMSLNVTK